MTCLCHAISIAHTMRIIGATICDSLSCVNPSITQHVSRIDLDNSTSGLCRGPGSTIRSPTKSDGVRSGLRQVRGLWS